MGATLKIQRWIEMVRMGRIRMVGEILIKIVEMGESLMR